MRINLYDELVADALGMTAALGRFDADLFRRGLGLSMDAHPDTDARAHVYVSTLEPSEHHEAFQMVLQRAAELEDLTARRQWPIAAMPLLAKLVRGQLNQPLTDGPRFDSCIGTGLRLRFRGVAGTTLLIEVLDVATLAVIELLKRSASALRSQTCPGCVVPCPSLRWTSDPFLVNQHRNAALERLQPLTGPGLSNAGSVCGFSAAPAWPPSRAAAPWVAPEPHAAAHLAPAEGLSVQRDRCFQAAADP